MRKTLLTLLSLLGATGMMYAGYNTATPYVDASVTPGVVSTFDVVLADDGVIEALQAAGQKVNDWRVDDATRFLYVWENTFTAGESSVQGVGYSGPVTDEYTSLNVGSAGWSGAGFFMGGVDNSAWNDNTRIHIAYRTNGPAPASVAFIIADGEVGNISPAKVAIGTDYPDGGATYTSVGNAASSEWQAIDLSFADLKGLYPAFNYVNSSEWTGNVLSILAGGVANTNICLDAIYFYTPGEAASGDMTVTPAQGFVANMGEVNIVWNGSTVQFANGKDIPGIQVLINGTPSTADEGGSYFIMDEDGWAVGEWVLFFPWDDVPQEGDAATGIGLGIYMPWTDLENAEYELKIPAGTLLIDGNPNEALNFEWKVVSVSEEYTTEPPKASTVKSLRTITLTWDTYKLALNPACTEKPTFGDWMSPEEVETVTINNEGQAIIDLGREVTANGWLTVNIPEGFFLLSSDEWSGVASPAAYLSYEINQFTAVPANQYDFDTPFESFSIFTEGIAVVGNIEQIEVINGDEDTLMTTAASYEEVTDETLGTGIKVNLAEPISGEYLTAKVQIPSGMFSFDGTVYDNPIELIYTINVLPDPEVTPASGSNLAKLDVVTITWDESPLEDIREYSDEPKIVTISYNGGAAEDISAYLKVENVMGPSPWIPEIEEPISGHITIDFGENAFTAEGKYEITIPAGVVMIYNKQYKENPEIVLTYTVGEGTGPSLMAPATLLEPAAEYLASIPGVTLTWDRQAITVAEGAEVTLTFEGEEYKLPVYGNELKESDEGIATTDDMTGDGENDDVTYYGVTFYNPGDIKFFFATGDFTYTIPEGIVRNADGQPNPQQTIVLTVLPKSEIIPTITPENENYGTATVATLSEIEISWDDKPLEIVGMPETISLNYNDLIGTASVVNNTLVLNVSALTQEIGEYNVVVGEGSVLIDGNTLNEELYFTYITTEVSLVKFAGADADGLYRVYNINGVNVMTTGNVDDLKGLENGIYIINGKKMILRK